MIKGARNPEDGQEVLRLGADRRHAEQGQGREILPDPVQQERHAARRCRRTSSTIKLIDYDFKKYGSSEERKRLLQKWDTEVSSLPQ